MTAPADRIRLGLDLTPLARGATGLATYVRGLLSARAQLDVDAIVGFVNRPSIGSVELDLAARLERDVRIVHSRVPRSWLERWWRARPKAGIEDWLGPVDVFHASDLLAPAARAAAIVLTVQDVAWRTDPSSATEHTAAWLEHWFETSLTRADVVICPSRATAHELERAFGLDLGRVHVVPHGVSGELTPDRTDRDASVLERHGLRPGYLLWVGALDRRKDLTTLAEGFARIADSAARNAPLVVVGPDGGAERALRSALRRHHADDRMIRLGAVPAPDLAPLYRGAGLALYLSRAEGFGLPVLEAMACGTPVVASRIAALEEVAGESALLVPPGDAQALADAIGFLLGDARECQRRGASGLERSRSYTWERCARLTAMAYREALGRRRSRGRYAAATPSVGARET